MKQLIGWACKPLRRHTITNQPGQEVKSSSSQTSTSRRQRRQQVSAAALLEAPKVFTQIRLFQRPTCPAGGDSPQPGCRGAPGGVQKVRLILAARTLQRRRLRRLLSSAALDRCCFCEHHSPSLKAPQNTKICVINISHS